MASLDDSEDVADLYYDELIATLEIRQAYMDIIVSNAQSLFCAFSEDSNLKARLTAALKLKTTDENALLRGLFLQAMGVFEEFVRGAVTSIVAHRTQRTVRYKDIEEKMRNSFISCSGKVLSFYGSGTVNGVKYDFDSLTNSLASCLSDRDDYYIEPRVFTILMGNCTSARIEKLFEVLGLPNKIFDEFGENLDLKKVLNERRKARVSDMARSELDSWINLRNNIAHGDLTTSLSRDDLQYIIEFLRSLIRAMNEACTVHLEN